MKSKPNRGERGQALIVIALAAIVLFGFVALAIDGTAKFSDHRHAQNAADTAAMAGALGLVNDRTAACGSYEEWECEALLRAEDNGYDDLNNNEVWVFKCSEPTADRGGAPLDCGPYEGNSDYLSVIILSHVDTTFARVLGFSQTHNLVQAVTYWNKRGPAYDGNLIVALNPNACTGSGANGNIALGTSGGGADAEINLTGGGAFVNSGGSGCGMEIMGCPEITVNGGSMSSTGNGNINLDVGSSVCQDKLTVPGPTYDQDQYPFPPEMPDVPGACSGSPQVPPNQTTLNPGYYTSFPPAKDVSNKNMSNNVTLNPGIYCLDTDLSLTNNKSITGSNVLIYLKPGNEFSIQGGTLTLSGRTEGDYQGYVIIVDSDFPTSGPAPDCTVNGNATATFTGTIFAPFCDIKIDGGGKTTSLSAQLIGYTVTITGNQTVNLTYNASDNAQSDPKIGLMR